MRLEFDSSVSLLEQRIRVAGAKTPGRKHQKRKGAKAIEKLKAKTRRRNMFIAKQVSKFKSEVSSYWRGERETYPEKRLR